MGQRETSGVRQRSPRPPLRETHALTGFFSRTRGKVLTLRCAGFLGPGGARSRPSRPPPTTGSLTLDPQDPVPSGAIEHTPPVLHFGAPTNGILSTLGYIHLGPPPPQVLVHLGLPDPWPFPPRESSKPRTPPLGGHQHLGSLSAWTPLHLGAPDSVSFWKRCLYHRIPTFSDHVSRGQGLC